jgi:hypothetical protein
MKDLHLMSEARLLDELDRRAYTEYRMGTSEVGREIRALATELKRRRTADLTATQEIEHRWGTGDADIFRLDEFGEVVHLRGSHGHRFWTHPEGYDPAYLAAVRLALAITAGYVPGAPG